MSVNKVILVGNVGTDPETRFTQTGKAVANFSMATSETWTDKEGKKQEKTEWHKIVVWDKLADVVSRYVTKGRQVYVEGNITTRKWQDKEGNDKYTTEIIARTIDLIGKKDAANETIVNTEIPF